MVVNSKSIISNISVPFMYEPPLVSFHNCDVINLEITKLFNEITQ